MLIVAELIPNKVIPTRRNLSWLNKSIVCSVKKRNLLFKQAKKTGDYRRKSVSELPFQLYRKETTWPTLRVTRLIY